MTAEAYSAERDIREWRWRLVEEPSFVYIVQGDPGTPIKVGVAKDPIARLAGLQTGNPQKLRILHLIPGDHVLEASLHHRLKDSRVHGEWFGEPGINDFLVWVKEYVAEVLRVFDETGQLPPVSPVRKIKRRGFGPDRGFGPQVGHRWRTSTGEEQPPMTVRFVEPTPLTDEERAERDRPTIRRRPESEETWYPGKEEAA